MKFSYQAPTDLKVLLITSNAPLYSTIVYWFFRKVKFMNNKWQQETVNTERFNKTDLLRDSSRYIQLVLANFMGTGSKLSRRAFS